MFSHYATRKITTTCKISTFSEDLIFLNSRSHLKWFYIMRLLESVISSNIITKNNIVWKLARGYCLCYCKTFSLVPDSTECTKIFLPKCAVHYLYHLKSNNIIGQRKTTNTEKHFYPWLISPNLKLSCTSNLKLSCT